MRATRTGTLPSSAVPCVRSFTAGTTRTGVPPARTTGSVAARSFAALVGTALVGAAWTGATWTGATGARTALTRTALTRTAWTGAT